MNQLVLASHNQGKLDELRAMLSPLGLRLIPQADFKVAEADEPHVTFVENALAKARHASKYTGLPAIADDAGLCIKAWGGAPGVNTAYYASQHGYENTSDNYVRILLEQMQKDHLLTSDQRKATMVSVLVALRNPEDAQPLIAVGWFQGQIALQPSGNRGFGFDPVMFIPQINKTFAEIPTEEKNRISHRGLAAQQMLDLLKNHWN
jgi:XTP/dITP diphosphohydrolase